MNVFESVKISLDSIRVNKLRASLTLLSIAIGVFAIMGAGNLVESIDKTVTEEMAMLGENSFSIYRIPKVQLGRHQWWKYRNRKFIEYDQYKEFKEKMTTTGFITASSSSGSFVLERGNFETDADVSVIGTDENYFLVNNVTLSKGRSFNEQDVEFRRNYAIIGNDVVVDLFPNEDPIDKEIRIGNYEYTVIGVLDERGAVLGQSQDNIAIVPISQYLRYYAGWWDKSLEISVKAYSNESLFATIDEAIGIMRSIRNVKPWEDNNFELETNLSISEQFSDLTGYLSAFGIGCGLIALLAAGVGIMNIMLVSVKERTKEIGIRKAVGAKKSWIVYQFLVESISLCMIGGIFGIAFGLLTSFVFGSAMNIKMSFSYDWLIVSVASCTFLGLVFGIYPALKAAKLDPIESLRYE